MQTCLALLWRPRFSAGRGTYSPYRHSAPHPVIFSRRESDSFHSFLDDAFPCRSAICLMAFCYSCYIHFNHPFTAPRFPYLPENRGSLPCPSSMAYWGYASVVLYIPLPLRLLSDEDRNQHGRYPQYKIDHRIQYKCRFTHFKKHPCANQEQHRRNNW